MFIFIHICICSHVIGTTTHLYTAAATQRGWCIEAFVLILAQLQSLSLSLSLYIYIYIYIHVEMASRWWWWWWWCITSLFPMRSWITWCLIRIASQCASVEAMCQCRGTHCLSKYLSGGITCVALLV